MGSVWLAEHLALRSWVAVKLMDPAIAATPEGAERFRREAQAAASLRSAHVVQVLDYGVHESTPYLVMELMHGESLAGCLERERRLTPERTVAIVTQVARALGRAHAAGIVHRDLKPDNIFLVREDDQELVKILDFGIAKTPPAQFGGMETRTGVTMGTPYYMSPEQVEGKKAVDFRTDLWAMAVITAECLTGVRPFDGATYGELLLNICARPIAPPSSQGFHLRGFDEWFARATSRDPEQRFASAQDLASTLREVVAGTYPPGAPVASPAAGYAPSQGPHAAPAGAPPTLTAGAAPSALSMSTSQALPLQRSSPLPWILLALVALAGAVGATVLIMRERPTAAALSPPAAPAAAAPDASAAVTLAPAPQASIAVPAANANANASAKPAAVEQPHAELPSRPTAAVAPATPPTAPTTAAAAAAPASPASKPAATATCFSDPFSGQIRPATANRAAGASTFACKQDPFTGRYKKL